MGSMTGVSTACQLLCYHWHRSYGLERCQRGDASEQSPWVIHVFGCSVCGPPPRGALRRVDYDSGLELELGLDVDLVAADSLLHGVPAQRRIALEKDGCSDARAWYRGAGLARGPAVRTDL